MYDLHCHLLPGADDGAVDLDMALAMARMAVDDGIATVACTPRVRPGLYENTTEGIRAALAALQSELDARDIRLRLVEGALAHLGPGVARGTRSGRIPTIAGSHYLLLELPGDAMPPRFEEGVFELMTLGITPVLAHPEGLGWIEGHYDIFVRMAARGAWLQVAAGALAGRCGRRVQYWGEKFVAEGHCHVLATGATHPAHRPPLLAEGREVAARLVGQDAAWHMVETRPRGIVVDADPSVLPPPLALTRGGARRDETPEAPPAGALRALLRGLFGRA